MKYLWECHTGAWSIGIFSLYLSSGGFHTRFQDVQKVTTFTDSALKVCPMNHPYFSVLLEANAACTRKALETNAKAHKNGELIGNAINRLFQRGSCRTL